MNTCGCAVSIRAPAGIFENNIVLNTSGWSVAIGAVGAGPWLIRNNTLLFASDATSRAGTGQSSLAGTLLLLNGRGKASITSNLFAFADNYALRCDIRQPNVSLDGNIFAADLYCHVTDGRYLWAHSANWDNRVALDSEFASVREDRVDVAPPRLDSTWADKVFTRLFMLPSRYSPEQWKRFATAVGASVTPPAAQAAPPPPPKPAARPKEPSLEDLAAELDRLKHDSAAKPAAAPTGPPYAPAYDWHKALQLAQDPSSTVPGAHHLKLDAKQ